MHSSYFRVLDDQPSRLLDENGSNTVVLKKVASNVSSIQKGKRGHHNRGSHPYLSDQDRQRCG